MGRATIADVARAAGVAQGTVSHVLNKPEVVAPATRRKVLRAIERLGYVPSAAARNLRTGHMATVGVVLPDLRNPFYNEVARGLEDRLDADGYSLLIGNSDSRPERERRHLQLFAAQGVTGVAVAPSGGDSGFLLELVERGVAVVLMEAELEDAPVSSIRVDNEAGARAAVGHLLGLGWSEVVLFNGPHDLRQCAERAAGARAGFAQAGLDPAGLTEVTLTNLNSVGGAAAAAAWFADHPGPTAVFCVNDLVAIGVQRYLTQRGGYNPREWPIAGFDDIEIAADRGVPITSVRQPAYEIGHRAGDLVLTRTPDSPVERVTLLPELVVRASTAA